MNPFTVYDYYCQCGTNAQDFIYLRDFEYECPGCDTTYNFMQDNPRTVLEVKPRETSQYETHR